MTSRRLTWLELSVFVELLAAFFDAIGRDPNQGEVDLILADARSMVEAGLNE